MAARGSAAAAADAARAGNDLDKPPTRRLAEAVLRAAIAGGATELHLTPAARSGNVRFFAGDQLRREVALRPFPFGLLFTRIKEMAGLPADSGGAPCAVGSFRLSHGNGRYGVLVTVTQTPWGETVALALAAE